MSYFQTIIARLLALTDGALATFTTVPQLLNSGDDCGAIQIINVSLDGCGEALIAELGSMIFGGVSLLNGLLTALGAGSY